MWMWLCVLAGTAVLAGGGYAGLKYYGAWALKREEAERERLAAEWKRRAIERQKKAEREAIGPGDRDDDDKITLE
jgi:hypothetical protein